MQSRGSSSGTDLQQLYGRWTTLMDRLQDDPKVSQVMNSRLGQYLSGHPFMALSAGIFTALAAVPLGLFLTFALVTIVMSAVAFVFVEGFLLFIGGVTLLFVLSGVAFFSLLASVMANTLYITSATFLKRYYPETIKAASVQEKESEDETPTPTET